MLRRDTAVKHIDLVTKYAKRMFPSDSNVQLVSIDDAGVLRGYFGPPSGTEFSVFVEMAISHKYNLYFTPNKVKEGFGGVKPKKSDIDAIRCIFLDLDPSASAPWDSEQARLARASADLAMSPVSPSFLVSTGGGIQAVWVFKDLISTDQAELVELIGRKLAVKFKGDSVQNIDRLLRMPGSINWPNEKKRQKGQTPRTANPQLFEPATTYDLIDLSRLADIPDNIFEDLVLGEMTVNEYAPSLDLTPPKGDDWELIAKDIDWDRVNEPLGAPKGFNLSAQFRRALDHDLRLQARWSGSTEGLKDTSRSGLDFSLTALIKRYGFSATDTFRILKAFPYGRGAEADRRYLCRLWLRAGSPIIEDEFSAFMTSEVQEQTSVSNVVSLTEVRQKVANGGSIVSVQAASESSNEDPSVEEYVQKYNKNHAVVIVGGKAKILNEQDNNFWELSAFKELYAGDRIRAGDKSVPATDAYRSAANTRRYSGIVFDPYGPITYGEENWKEKAAKTKGRYNMWRGFSTRPALLEGEDAVVNIPKVRDSDYDTRKTNTKNALARCHRFVTHIRENICRGDLQLFREFMGFHAHIVQHPGERPDKALVVIGDKGTGKSFVFDRIKDMIGDAHAVVLTMKEQLTGKFNGILAAKLYAVSDEASFGFDPSQDGIIKNLITQNTTLVEYKGAERVAVKNYTRYVFLSNSKLPVFVSPDERRYVMFKMSNARRQDESYFSELKQEWDSGGRQAFMRYLMEYDIERSGWSPHKAYRSEHLREMQFAAQSPCESFIYDSISFGGYWIGGTTTGGQGEETSIERVYELYVRYSQARGQRHTASMLDFRQIMGTMLSDAAIFRVNENGIATVTITDTKLADKRIQEHITGANLT